MSQPDGIDRALCPICHNLVSVDELCDNSGLCALCDDQNCDVRMDNRTIEKEEEIDESET